MTRLSIRLAVLTALVALPFVAAAAGEPFVVSLATRILILGIVTIGVDLLVGVAGLATLGHAMFFGLGGYLTVLLSRAPGQWGREALMAWPLALLVVAAIALVVGHLCLRARGFQFIMITLAFAQMVYLIFSSTPALGGDEGLRLTERQTLGGMSLVDPTIFYYVCLAAGTLVLAGAYAVAGSRFGMVLQGCRQNERRIIFLGVRTHHYLLLAFVLSAIAAALSGILLANFNRFVTPGSLSWIQSADFLIMIMVGGLGRLHGGPIGAALLILLEQLLSGWIEEWQFFLGAVLLIIELWINPWLDRLVAKRSGSHG